jgi:Ca2+-binding EF-hand superfamily protein
MTKRELILSAALLIVGITGGNLWLQLRDARKQLAQFQEPQLRSPESVRPVAARVPPGSTKPVSTAGQVASPAPPEPSSATATERPNTSPGNRNPDAGTVMGSNDLNKDGIITRDEAKSANKLLAFAWDRYDLNKDGMVTPQEVEESAAKGAQGPGSGGGLGGGTRRIPPSSVLSTNDVNGDGIITRDEARSVDKNLNRSWETYDTNMDGVVDANELKRAGNGRR